MRISDWSSDVCSSDLTVESGSRWRSMAGQHHRHPHDHDVDAELERILSALRDDGGRVTTGRRAVVRALLTADDHHVTAEDIAATVQRDHPDVHLSTVYRTLAALAPRGRSDAHTSELQSLMR